MGSDEWDDDDETYAPYDYDDEGRDHLPDFGCACENALFVDMVCASCISYLAEQDRKAKDAAREAWNRRATKET